MRKFTFGSTIAEVKQKLGQPRSERIEKVGNQHQEAQVDELHTLFFDGVAVTIYKVADGAELVADVVLTKGEQEPMLAVTIGAPLETVLEVLGAPKSNENNVLTYCAVEGPPTMCVDIALAERSVREIHWRLPPD